MSTTTPPVKVVLQVGDVVRYSFAGEPEFATLRDMTDYTDYVKISGDMPVGTKTVVECIWKGRKLMPLRRYTVNS